MKYLKKSKNIGGTVTSDITTKVAEMLMDIRLRGKEAVEEFANKYDNWDGDFVINEQKIQKLCTQVSNTVKSDLEFAHKQITEFARKQLDSINEFSTEIYPGLKLGQRLIPIENAGCYVPGGRFTHAISAIMSVATAKVAGVPFVVACTPPKDISIDPVVAYALSLSKADVVMAMGGVQAIASMAFGLFCDQKADIIVGPGNAYVAEAKRLLYGQTGIDVFAGPTESLIIADSSANPIFVAVDLVGQAEHGFDSPVWLVTDSLELAEEVLNLVPRLIAELPEPEAARISWRDYGEVVLCHSREEMARTSDDYAAEHVQVMAKNLQWWLERLKNYGSLFLGEECAVPFGDKASGTNHILPTIKAACYSGGLNVHKFIKVLTWQRISKKACRKIAGVTSRISRMEGMEGHARSADLRLKTYFPSEQFDFEVYKQKEL